MPREYILIFPSEANEPKSSLLGLAILTGEASDFWGKLPRYYSNNGDFFTLSLW